MYQVAKVKHYGNLKPWRRGRAQQNMYTVAAGKHSANTQGDKLEASDFITVLIGNVSLSEQGN